MEFDKLKIQHKHDVWESHVIARLGSEDADCKMYFLTTNDEPLRKPKEYARLFAAAPELYEAAKQLLPTAIECCCKECSPTVSCQEMQLESSKRMCGFIAALPLVKALDKAQGRYRP